MIIDNELYDVLIKLDNSIINNEFNDVLECVKYLLNQYILFNENNYSLKEVIEEFKNNTTTM